MQHEPGDEYIRRLAAFVRANEKNLAEGGPVRRRRTQQSQTSSASVMFNRWAWFSSSSSVPSAVKPVVLCIDIHRLFYVIMRLESLGMDVGSLDVEVENPSRPVNYIHIPDAADNADTRSLLSLRSSLSAMSTLSLSGSWWSQREPVSIEAELKYLFTSFNILPALSVTAAGKKGIAELAYESPNRNALPLDVFRNLQSLECVDIDPRLLLGWDRLAESLRSLTIKRSGLEDMTDIFLGAVLDDQARRSGSASRRRRRCIQSSTALFYGHTSLPDAALEVFDEDATSHLDEHLKEATSQSHRPSDQASSLKWAFLKHLSLSDNALTGFPAESAPYLTSLTHLDLSSNLLVTVPSGLSTFYNLVSLNLSDNMIDSVLGIYLNLGQVVNLNLSSNRLDSICGLERLLALETVDLRGNYIEDSAEVGRLATLPYIAEIFVDGNPFVEIEENYRAACFDYFWKEGKSVRLDGTEPSFYEKRNLAVSPPQQMTSSRLASTANSPPVVAVGHSQPFIQGGALQPYARSASPSKSASPSSDSLVHPGLVCVADTAGRARRKKRIVKLEADHGDVVTSSRSPSHAQFNAAKHRLQEHIEEPSKETISSLASSAPAIAYAQPNAWPISELSGSQTSSVRLRPAGMHGRPRGKHGRYQTESALYAPPEEKESNGNDILSSSTSTAPVQQPSRRREGSATFASRPSARRARVSASVYVPPGSASDGEDGEFQVDAEAYRQRIETLKQDMGEGWLKVFSQRV